MSKGCLLRSDLITFEGVDNLFHSSVLLVSQQMDHKLRICAAGGARSRVNMALTPAKTAIVIRDLESIDDLRQVEAVEKEVWRISDRDSLPLTFMIASKEAGNLWLGAFADRELVGFAFGLLGREGNTPTVHSHMLAVRAAYQDLDLGYKLKLAQRERALALGISRISWTFDPLQSKNAHFNFAKLGVISDNYKVDFYGPQTSSVLHRNGTDRLWVEWRLASKRVQRCLAGRSNPAQAMEGLSNLVPLVQFNGNGKPARTDLQAALSRQRIAIEIPSDINALEQKDPALAGEWRQATRWAFTEALGAGFFVAEFCRSIRGQQGPGVYLLQKGTVEEFTAEF
jgi:predicted GNAT superfamily acetyltransferase